MSKVSQIEIGLDGVAFNYYSSAFSDAIAYVSVGPFRIVWCFLFTQVAIDKWGERVNEVNFLIKVLKD